MWNPPDTYKDKVQPADDPHYELNSKLDDMRDAGMRITKTWKEVWLLAMKYAWGQQLQDITPNEDWNYIVLNRIYPLMFQSISGLAQNNPKVLCFPWDQDKENVAEFVEQWAGYLQYLWESEYELNMRLKLILGLLDCALYGYMVGYNYYDSRAKWDQDEKQWIGKVKHTFVHPACFWADPTAESLHKDHCDSCGMVRRVRLEWAQDRWPKFKDKMKAEAYTSADPQYFSGDLISYEDQKGKTLEAPNMKFNRIIQLVLKQGMKTEDGGSQSKQQFVDVELICWKDSSTRHVKIEDNVPENVLLSNGKVVKDEITGLYIDREKNEPLKEWPRRVIAEYDEPKFPEGRYVLRIGRCILNPKEQDQVWEESNWPFTVMPYHILPHMWQGANAVEMARNNNDMLNLSVSAMVRRLLCSADPERLIEAGALARDREGKLRQTNPFGIGKYIIASKGKFDKIRNMEYAPLDAAVILLAQVLKQDIDDQMFIQDVSRGAASTGGLAGRTGKKSATEVARLDTNAQKYMRLQGVFLDGWIDRTLTNIAETVQRRYEPGRIIRIIGTDRDKNLQTLSQGMLDVKFDVNIEPGSTLPFDEELKKRDYMTAYKMLENPIPNPMLDEMLRILNISNRQKILAKHQGVILFRQFVMLSQLIKQIPPENVMAIVQRFPALKPIYQLMMQAGQLQIPGMKPPEMRQGA